MTQSPTTSAGARIRLVSEASASDEERAAIAELRKPRPGPLINIHAAILNAPTLIGPFIALADALRNQCQLDPGLRELAILSVLKTSRSRYEFLRHWKLALAAGVPEEKLLALDADVAAGPYTDLERAVMRLASDITRDVHAQSPAWSEVHRSLGDRQTVELLMNVGLYNMTGRLSEPIALQDEVGFQPAPGSVETFSRITSSA